MPILALCLFGVASLAGSGIALAGGSVLVAIPLACVGAAALLRAGLA